MKNPLTVSLGGGGARTTRCGGGGGAWEGGGGGGQFGGPVIILLGGGGGLVNGGLNGDPWGRLKVAFAVFNEELHDIAVEGVLGGEVDLLFLLPIDSWDWWKDGRLFLLFILYSSDWLYSWYCGPVM